MAKDRWANYKKLDAWLDAQLKDLDEWGGHGSAIDAMANFIDDKHFMSLCAENGLKAIDIFEYVNGGVQFGQDAEAGDYKIFYTYYDSVNLYFLAKNKTDFKTMVLKAVHDWKEACEPIEPEPPSRDEIIESLLKDIYGHIRDPKGRSDMEANWATRIEELGYGK